MKAAWYAFVRWLVRVFFFKGTGGLRVNGLENIPRTGPLLVCPNHVSHLDPPVIACSMDRPVTFMAKAELFDHRGFGALIRSLGAFPVRRGEGDTEAIRTSIKLLAEGKALLMFPEGTRGEGLELLPVSKGVAMIAKRAGAPVLPVGISGTHRKWPKGGKKPKWGRVTVSFGKPLRYDRFDGHATEAENRQAFAEALENAIVELCRLGGYEVLPAKTSEPESDSTTIRHRDESSAPTDPGGADTPAPR